MLISLISVLQAYIGMVWEKHYIHLILGLLGDQALIQHLLLKKQKEDELDKCIEISSENDTT